MKLLKDRRVAITVVAVVAVLASLLGMRVSLGRQQSKLEKEFLYGSDASQKGVGMYLRDMDANASNLVKIGAYYPETAEYTEELQEARAKYAAAENAQELYQAYLALQTASEHLYQSMSGISIDAVDREMLEKYYTSGVADLAKKTRNVAAAYNDSVDAYNQLFSQFPVSVLHKLVGLSEAERFA